MNRATGAALDGYGHLAQSIAEILTTPLGSRVARRDFGSELPDLIDAPGNAATRVRLFAATATALMRWEPRIALQRVQLVADDARNGKWFLDLLGKVTDAGTVQSMRVPLAFNGAGS